MPIKFHDVSYGRYHRHKHKKRRDAKSQSGQVATTKKSGFLTLKNHTSPSPLSQITGLNPRSLKVATKSY